MWASKRVGGGGTVLALEPNLTAYFWLQKNTRGLGNVVPLRVAAYSTNGLIETWSVNNSATSTVHSEVLRGRVPNLEKGHSARTKAVRLDGLERFIKGQSQEIIIKIDVEGSELEVLKGTTGILPRVRMLAIEVHSEELEREVRRFLESYGFHTEIDAITEGWPSHVIATRNRP
jgi:FkbM family methyltransferase